MSNQEKATCFVIMPYSVREHDLPKYNNDSEHWSEVYHGLISPAIKNAGLIPLRDDEDYSSRLVGEGVWSKIEQADIILCDMSSHNPNAHLELGWALRADKKIVLIKDEKTSFNFDLNQFYTYQYISTLQPRVLKQSIIDISKIIKNTLNDSVSKYSMVSKLDLNKRAIDASNQGNLEISLLKEVLNEIRSVKNISNNSPIDVTNYQIKTLNKSLFSELSTKLLGSTWRKKNGLEEIVFTSEEKFVYSSVGTQKWLENDVTFEKSTNTMKLNWRHDGYIANCKFDSSLSRFTEQDGVVWYLIAREPFIHSSFKY